MKLLTYEKLAQMVYDWNSLVEPVRRKAIENTFGRELFQKSKIDDTLKQCVQLFMCGQPLPELEENDLTVLKIRLLFARDYFWSRHHHFPVAEPWDSAKAAQLITQALTDTWHTDGLSWLVLHRASLPISKACQHWELCESARWAMLEYKETESWGYTPGKLTKDPAQYTLDDLRALARNLKQRVERGENNPFPTKELHYIDVSEASSLSSTEWLAEDLQRLMKDASYQPSSASRSSRLSKRLEFASVFMSIFQEKRKITKREAYATIGILCSVVWAKHGKSWLDSGTKTSEAEDVIEWGGRPYHITFEDLPHAEWIIDMMECPGALAYFDLSEPYQLLTYPPSLSTGHDHHQNQSKA